MLITPLVLGAYRASLAGSARAFERGLRSPREAQGARLKAVLALTAQTKVGRRFGLESVYSVRAFQQRVPAQSYDALEADIAAVAAGESGVLTTEPVRRFELSSGSSAAQKRVPITDGFLRELSAATGPWLHALLCDHPLLRRGRQYWAISPAGAPHPKTAGGIPIGTADDTEYFGPLARRAIRLVLAVPPELAAERHMGRWRRRTLVGLLECEDLALISVWSPSFLAGLMETLEEELSALLAEVAPARRARIASALDSAGALHGEAIWPALGLISCWAEGPSAQLIAKLQRFFPRVKLQPKGLLATEGVVSIPYASSSAVLAVSSHFLEFEDLNAPNRAPLLADELQVDGLYSPLLTTSAGLLRYRLGDAVRCVGRVAATPTVRFEGRCDSVSDLCGEKLSPARVGVALKESEAVLGRPLVFALLAPSLTEQPHYRLYVESNADDSRLQAFAEAVERALCEGHPYRHCRALGQLGPVTAVRVREGWNVYEAQLAARGIRSGMQKPTALDARGDWAAAFAVAG